MADAKSVVPKARVEVQGVPTDILVLRFANATQVWITQLDRAGTVVGLDVLAKQVATLLHKRDMVGAKKPLCFTCSLKSYDQATVKDILSHVDTLAGNLK
ncbi:hypothetical protein PTSG_01306 [Salpingoeca rosetta]|uniref:Proteasome assembly chaperone 3 n=1 Tax=Salpingoeca rosetta (strain ATCC 50818 / BSB-021) TaxID=946362 RepID=F2TZY8_SALR5|nr:uncharacterized protein PTSG_01306 [Salpingoeca rosetta]EGD80716.1 hypothetical protein PTSG_01306 [Salpingoeca rosetta]|eukprot:XP_004997277.1 hypothetical protein PTSG_01306 [Salpingoeca rosetta]